MKLAPDSHAKFEMFFREFYKDEHFKLPVVHFYAGNFSRLLTRTLKIFGITIGSRIFIKPDFLSLTADKRRRIHVELAAHEIAHVLQYERDGFARFFYKYLESYRRNLKNEKWSAAARLEAYLAIPYEIEARETAARFVEWNEENGKWIMDNEKVFTLSIFHFPFYLSAKISYSIFPSSSSFIAMRVDFDLRKSIATRGSAPRCICLLRWAARIILRYFESFSVVSLGFLTISSSICSSRSAINIFILLGNFYRKHRNYLK